MFSPYVGDNLQIKALIAPSGVTWPSDIPTWQGNFSDTSLSDTRIVDTSQTDEFTITAECGTSQKCVEIEVKPVELKIPPAVLRDGQAENPQNTLQIKAGNKKYKLKISVTQGTGSAVFAGNKTEIEYTGKASDEWDKVFIQGVLESSQENNIKITILLDNKEIASVTTIVYSEIKSVFSSAERQHKDSTEECLTCTANGNNILDSPPMGHTTGLIHSTTFHMLCSHCNSYCAHCCLSILKGGKQDSYRALGTTSVTANHNLGMNLLLIFFIVTMSSYVEMTLLETNLPTSGGSDAEKIDLQNSLKIELSASGDYIVNGIPQSRDALENLLRRYARLMPDAEFLLQCDPESRHHMLVTLLSDLAKYRLKNVKLLK